MIRRAPPQRLGIRPGRIPVLPSQRFYPLIQFQQQQTVPPVIKAAVIPAHRFYTNTNSNQNDPGGPMVIFMPSRRRPAQALAAVKSAVDTKSPEGDVRFVVGIEPDDEVSYKSVFGVSTEQLMLLQNGGCYVAAMREMMKRSPPSSIYGLLSDDFVFETPSWDSHIRGAFSGLSERIGVVWAADGIQNQNLATAPFLSAEWIETVGDIIPGDYRHMFCDTEITDIAKQSNTARFLSDVAIRHHHYMTGGSAHDETYQRNNTTYLQGQNTFANRKSERQSLVNRINEQAANVPDLSVLVCGLNHRVQIRSGLLTELWQQRSKLSRPKDVEIKVLSDAALIPTGTKRNQMIASSRGKYFCFVDDDDSVVPDYLTALLEALKSEPDCVTFRGIMTTEGKDPRGFDFSLRYKIWSTQPDGTYLRNPNHLCATKRSVVGHMPFPPITHAEDRIWSDAIYPLLKTEVKIDRVLYKYLWSPSKKVG